MRPALGLLVAALLVALPAPIAAADSSQTLPDTTIGAVGVDLDGDGVREVVRMASTTPGSTFVDAWRHRADGWARIGAAPMVSPDDLGNATLADANLGTGALLLAARDGRERLLALTAEGVPGDPNGQTCCLTLAEVREVDGDLALVRLAAEWIDDAAGYFHAVDLDGDGTDELVTASTSFESEGHPADSRVTIMSWDGERYAPIADLGKVDAFFNVLAGETDGLPGDDVLAGPTAFGNLTRITMMDGEVVVTEGHLHLGERADGWLAGIAGGKVIIAEGEGLGIIDWPHAGQPGVAARIGSPVFPSVGVVGEGSDALLVVQAGVVSPRQDRPATVIYDLGLRELGTIRADPGMDATWELVNAMYESGRIVDRPIHPYLGPMPRGSAAGPASYALGGAVVSQDGAGGYETRPMSELAGLAPLGTAGPGDGWLMLSDGLGSWPISGQASISAGSFIPFGSGELRLAPLDAVMAPDDPGSQPLVELRGAVQAQGGRLQAGPDGFEAIVSAPPGSVVVSHGGTVVEQVVANAPLAVTISAPRSGTDRNREFDASLLIITPDGRTTLAAWTGTFVREFPELTATAATVPFELRATLSGRTSLGASVSIDGRPVDVGTDGDFAFTVDAPIWPNDVVVQTRDLLGNETTVRVQVVGLVDYRGLPWVPILGLVTLAAGAYVYVRVPRRRLDPAPASAGDGTLEEIEPD